MKVHTFAAVVMLAWAALSAAQQPRLASGQMVPRPAGDNLASTLAALRSQPGPLWVAYSVAMIEGERHMCCLDSWERFKRDGCCGGCRLEKSGGSGFFTGTVDGCDLEPAKVFFVFARFEKGQLGRVRSLSTSCGADLGGMTLYWLGEVPGAQSVGWLTSLVKGTAAVEKRHFDDVVSAIALHADSSADVALEKFAAAGQPYEMREQAVFWLAQTRGRRGYEIVRDLLRNDADTRFREHAVFALTQSSEAEAQQELIRLAHEDRDSEVRGQALFWLAQKAGDKIAGVITDAIERDPETEVKKKAVFALTQMPEEEGVPLLINLARSNRNPVVRKEAVFWLGQSDDRRALEFIESLLK